MINDINDEVTLAARLLLVTLFLICGWRKLKDYSGTVSLMVQGWRSGGGTGYCRSDLHGAFGCVRDWVLAVYRQASPSLFALCHGQFTAKAQRPTYSGYGRNTMSEL